MKSTSIYVAAGLCCASVILALAGKVNATAFQPSAAAASPVQAMNCWVSAPCDPATNLARDD